MTVRFRPMTENDLPAIRDWLHQPHVREWWGDPDEQYALINGDRNEPAMDQYIMLMNDEPAGYLQCYALTQWNEGFGPQPQGTRGIDLFIAGPERIGRGYGPLAISAFCNRMFQRGVPRVVTDPSPANARAIRAYEKAGFRHERPVETPDGRALLMWCQPGDLPRSQSEPS
jgi:aminoglycoside 6'-N-acetyltransferase